MRNKVVKSQFHSADLRTWSIWGWRALFALMRVLFGVGWLLAGVTKVLGEGGSSGHSWFAQPGVFLTDYLIKALDKPNVPGFYKSLIEDVALNQVMVLNYAIPVVQIIVGLFLIAGFMIFPSVLICLFMHINFILSGNINVMSLTLYTTAFGILLSGTRVYAFSLDCYLKIGSLFIFMNRKPNTGTLHALPAMAQMKSPTS
ncbi:hypothetical protein [Paenibacillus montanisoli]|nr:hypothetical protein [Paenibacillus montanisoli]